MVKIYAKEPETALVLGAGALIISELARVEVVSAIRRKSRIEGMSRASADILIATFENDLSRRETAAGVDFTVIRLGQDILDEAILILDRHPLTAGDAIQLATAILTRRLIPNLTVFHCFDQHLRTAASAEGFVLQPA